MLMLSITPMDISHVDEICEDLRLQQEQGISDCAMLTAHLEAEGTPPVSKGAIYGKLYRQFREKLEPMGVRSGVLVQSTLGHIYPPNVENPFQKAVSLVSGDSPYVFDIQSRFAVTKATIAPTIQAPKIRMLLASD